MEPDEFDFPDRQLFDTEISDEPSDSEEGEVSSDTLDKPEQTPEMNYRETDRSIWSFMGWNHVPTFESDLSEQISQITPGKGRIPRDLPEFQ